jgi:predicted N-acetyltransferase YhbS
MDQLIRLYDLDHNRYPVPAGYELNRALPHQKLLVVNFIRDNFSTQWAHESELAFSRQPLSLILARHNGIIVGFCAYECTGRGFVGPMGVYKDCQGKGLGKALIQAGFVGLREMGYAYAILGNALPGFYEKYFGAINIPDSEPGWYAGRL